MDQASPKLPLFSILIDLRRFFSQKGRLPIWRTRLLASDRFDSSQMLTDFRTAEEA